MNIIMVHMVLSSLAMLAASLSLSQLTSPKHFGHRYIHSTVHLWLDNCHHGQVYVPLIAEVLLQVECALFVCTLENVIRGHHFYILTVMRKATQC